MEEVEKVGRDWEVGYLPDCTRDGRVDVGGRDCFGCAKGKGFAVDMLKEDTESVKRYGWNYLASTGYDVTVIVSVAVEITMGVDAVCVAAIVAVLVIVVVENTSASPLL